MVPRKLSEKRFLETFKYAPRIALNILVKNSKGEILLTKRAIPPKKGSWHYPGGFILRGEKLAKCFTRISEKELGVRLNFQKAKLLGVFENIDGDERGHILDLIYGYQTNSKNIFKLTHETAEIRFFESLPSRLGFSHKSILAKLGYR